jgi:hypothetical protein
MATVLDTPAQIDGFRLAIMIQQCKAKARGMSLTRAGASPRLTDIRRQYGIKAKTWADAAVELEALRG